MPERHQESRVLPEIFEPLFVVEIFTLGAGLLVRCRSCWASKAARSLAVGS
jgi:hypothetical protein